MTNENTANNSSLNVSRQPSLNKIVAIMGNEVAVGFKWGATRTRSWRTPPNWSFGDWCDELMAVAIWSAWQAKQDFDPSCDVPLAEFVSSHIQARALTRYRQEWRFAQGIVISAAEVIESLIAANPTTHSSRLAFESLGWALEHISNRERWLLVQIFWQHRTETDIAAELQISQPAVNKLKRVALHQLRDLL